MQPTTVLLGCIADDLTGASDLAGILARSGAPVSLRLGIPEADEQSTAAIEVIALKCRSIPAADAVAQTRAACAWLRDAGSQRFFWKYCSTFDSTPAGNIGPVAEALLDELGAVQTIYCPAFPENNRSVYMGNLYVGDQLLAESPMRDHPLTPMHDSNLPRLLTPQVSKAVGLIDRRTVAQGAAQLRSKLAKLCTDKIVHVVIDAICDEDLATIATACHEMPLLTGGSAIAMSLPSQYQQHRLLDIANIKYQPPALPAGTLLLAGSCSAMTQTQVANYLKLAPSYRLDPTQLATTGSAAAIEWMLRQPAESNSLLYATAAPAEVKAVQEQLGADAAGELIENCLAELAVAAFANGIRRFVLAGGESAGAVAAALNVKRLDIGTEIAPGVSCSYAQSHGENLALVFKSGNFGAENFFRDALTQLA